MRRRRRHRPAFAVSAYELCKLATRISLKFRKVNCKHMEHDSAQLIIATTVTLYVDLHQNIDTTSYVLLMLSPIEQSRHLPTNRKSSVNVALAGGRWRDFDIYRLEEVRWFATQSLRLKGSFMSNNVFNYNTIYSMCISMQDIHTDAIIPGHTCEGNWHNDALMSYYRSCTIGKSVCNTVLINI